MIRFERDEDLAVGRADGRIVAERQIVLRHADVINHDLHVLGGTTLRISSSTCEKICSLSSSRVPGGASTCKRN